MDRSGRVFRVGFRSHHSHDRRHARVALRVALPKRHGLEHELCLQFDGVQRLFCHLLLDCDDRGRGHIYTAGLGLSGLELLRFPRPGQGPGLRSHNEAPVDCLQGGARKGAPGKMTEYRRRLGRAEPLVGSMTNDFELRPPGLEGSWSRGGGPVCPQLAQLRPTTFSDWFTATWAGTSGPLAAILCTRPSVTVWRRLAAPA